MSRIRSRPFGAVILAAICGLVIAACGSSSSSGTASTASAGSPGGATDVSAKLNVPTETIGVLPYVGAASEVLEQDVDAIKAGAAALGWKVQYTDPNGSTSVMQSAMASMIQNHVAAILTMAIDAPLLGGELAAAKAAGIPVIDVNNSVDPKTMSEFSAEIAPSEGQWGTEWGNYMKASLKPGPVLEMVAPPYNVYHGVDIAMGIAKSAGFTTSAVEETDVTNLEESYQNLTRAGLQAHTSTKYMLVPADFGPPLIEPTLKLLNRSDVTLITRYDDKATIALMKAGANIVDVTTNLYLPGLMGLDQVAAYVMHKTPFHSVLGGSAFPFRVITKANLSSYPSTGYAYSLAATLKPFVAKWEKEYAK